MRLIAPVFAGTTLDTPHLPPRAVFHFEPQAGGVFIDAGGDDAGVTALGGLHGQLEETATRCSTSSTATGCCPKHRKAAALWGDRGRQPPERLPPW